MLLSQNVSPSALICQNAEKCAECQVKEILIHSALKVEIEVKRSGVRFQLRHFLPALSVLLVDTGLYSRSVLKQMTPGFPTIDHNKKNTPTAYCSHLLLQRHPHSLSLSFLFLHSYFSRCVLFNSS